MTLALMSARVNVSAVPTSGLGSPLRTNTPTPTREMTVTLPAASLPSFSSASAEPLPVMTMSNTSSFLTRSATARAGERVTCTRCPDFCSKAGTSSLSELSTAPGVRSLSSSAMAGRATIKSRLATIAIGFTRPIHPPHPAWRLTPSIVGVLGRECIEVAELGRERDDSFTSRSLRAFGFGCLGALIGLALDDARRLAAASAQIIELGASHLAATHDLDRVDHRRIEREYALNALAIRDLTNREVLVEARAGAADADAFVGLNAAFLALDHLDVDEERVAWLKIRNLLAGGKLRDLLLLELLDQIHGKSPSAAPVGSSGLSGAYVFRVVRVGRASTTKIAACHAVGEGS